jgi:hypothetical protein
VTIDIFEKHDGRLQPRNDATTRRPKVSIILCASTSASGAERLAGISGRDDVNHAVSSAAPPSGCEGSRIVPNSRAAACLDFHALHERGRSTTFPLTTADNIGSDAERFEGDADAVPEHSGSGGDFKHGVGGFSHKGRSPSF